MWFVILLVVLGAVVFGLHSLFPDALRAEDNRMALVYGLVLMTTVGASILFSFRQRWSQALKYGVTWALILLVVIAAYSYRDAVQGVALRIAGEVVPGMAVETAPGEVTLRAGGDGHFYANADLNGLPVRLLVDTGATTIALAAEDAARLGFDPDALAYQYPVATANGTTLAARVTLDRVAIGSIGFERVGASVMPPGALEGSLLGMNFLERLAGFEFAGDRLVLRR